MHILSANRNGTVRSARFLQLQHAQGSSSQCRYGGTSATERIQRTLSPRHAAGDITTPVPRAGKILPGTRFDVIGPAAATSQKTRICTTADHSTRLAACHLSRPFRHQLQHRPSTNSSHSKATPRSTSGTRTMSRRCPYSVICRHCWSSDSSRV